MDYAIVKTGGKQYRVKPGDVIDVEKLPSEEGSAVALTDVLALSRDGEVMFGAPLVPDASVIAQVREHDRDDKIIVFKYKRKVRYRRKKGHRQHYTRLAITAIMLGDEEIGVIEPDLKVAVQDEVAVALGGEPEAEVAEEPVGEILQDGLDEADGEAVEAGLDDIQDELDEEVIGEASKDEPEDEIVEEPQGEVEVQPADEVSEEPGDSAVRRSTRRKKPEAEVEGNGP